MDYKEKQRLHKEKLNGTILVSHTKIRQPKRIKPEVSQTHSKGGARYQP